MKLFGEVALDDAFRGQWASLEAEVIAEPRNKLLNVNESEYAKYLAEKYQIEPLVIELDDLQSETYDRIITREDFPHFGDQLGYGSPVGQRRQVIIFHQPFTGNKLLLRFRPSTHLSWFPEVKVTDSEIIFEIINFRDNRDELRREVEEFKNNIRKQFGYFAEEIQNYNSTLENHARKTVSGRNVEILKQADVVTSLGIPLRKAEGVPQTFAVPIVAKRLAVKPLSQDVTFAPEPALDETSYQDILSIIHDFGVAMERHPSIYASREEEDLRDFLLMVLGTHYANTTGETFNKKGKTDILVRHQGRNIFVGECKFWTGLKGFYETIDQILGYLTWRDSKAAIVCFVDNKEFQPVLDQISNETKNHSCFVGFESKPMESWWQFEFHLKTDPNRNVHLGVLCFHFPPS